MEVDLKTFLDKLRVSKGEPFTHTTKSTGSLVDGWPAGSYYIDDINIDKFWAKYCNEIRKRHWLTITEYPGKYGPLRVDFDFKSSINQGVHRQYNLSILQSIVGIYQEEIRKISSDDCEEKTLWCIVLEKPAPRVEQGVVKDGFHLHFPHFICEGWIQDEYLRDKVSTQMIEKGIWKGTNFTTRVEDFIDKGIARKPWMMYGSMNYKDKNSVPYIYNRWSSVPEKKKYGRVFNHKIEEIDMHSIFEDEMIGRPNSVRYYLPRFLTIRGYIKSTTLIPGIQKRQITIVNRKSHGKRIQRNFGNLPRKRRIEEVMADIKLIQDGEIMSMISEDRANAYDEWMDIGWTLFNVGQGCDEALDMWIEFSRQSTKFKEGECEELWDKMELRNKTIASLLAMAKNDSPGDYKGWKNSNVRGCIDKSLYEYPPTEYDVAMVVYKMYEDRFVCADAKKDIWYQFSEHRWNYMDDGITLKDLLADEVVEQYCEFRKTLHEELGKLEYRIDMAGKDDSAALVTEHKEKSEKKKRCTKIIHDLKTCSFQEKVLKMCKLKMYDKDFFKKLDENRNLLGCENGVLDLDLLAFRDGRPDDYITFSTGLSFQTYRQDDDDVQELNEYLLKVYPNENRRNYFLDFMASCLQGGNINKRFLIATGPSDGAKSMTVALLELTFGCGNEGYFGKFSRELITQSTGRNSSSGPRPELARVRGKRIMGCQEITKNERINIGFVKEATGNDSFYTRGMYEKGTEISPQFTLLMQCNDPPSVPGHDEATWSRIRVLDHEAKFVKPQDLEKYPVPDDFEEQLKLKRFKADPTFRERLNELAPVLLWKLFEKFKVYKKTGLIEPDEVMASTDEYQSDNDIYRQFIRDRIEKETNEETARDTYIKLSDAHSEFKEWYQDNYPSYSREKIGKNTLKHELSKRLGTIRDSETDIYGFGKLARWWGYRFIPDDSEESDFQSHLGITEN